MYSVKLMSDGSLDEIYQTVAMRFAFAKIIKEKDKFNVEQLHPFIKCRDFLGDAMWATHFKKPYSIYGFSFDGTKNKVQLDKTVLLIEYEEEKKLKDVLKVLKYFEGAAKWKRTKLIKIDKKTNSGKKVFLAIGSARWMSSPTLISLYTLLLRLAGVGINKDESVDDFITRCEKITSNDGRYLTAVKSNGIKIGLKKHPFYTLMRRNKAIFKDAYKNGKDTPTGEVHNYHGVLGLTNRAVSIYGGQLKPVGFINDWAGNLVEIAKKAKT